jgi:hypothetical protein
MCAATCSPISQFFPVPAQLCGSADECVTPNSTCVGIPVPGYDAYKFCVPPGIIPPGLLGDGGTKTDGGSTTTPDAGPVDAGEG